MPLRTERRSTPRFSSQGVLFVAPGDLQRNSIHLLPMETRKPWGILQPLYCLTDWYCSCWAFLHFTFFFFFFHCHCHCSLNQASGTIKDVWQNSIQTPWLHTLVANYWRCMLTELRLNLYTSPPPALVRTTLHTWTATSQKYTPTLFHSFLCHITSSKQVHSFFLIPICLNCIDLFRQDPCPLNRHSFNPSSCSLWVHHQQSYPLGDRL